MEKRVIVVGFGRDLRLVDLVKKIGTPEEDDILKIKISEGQIMDYRDIERCTPEEIEAFFTFVIWLTTKPEFKEKISNVR